MSAVPDIRRLFDLKGRTALVTGASSGIGRTIAEALAGAGARIVAVARRKPALNEVVRSLREAGTQAEAIRADVADRDEIARLADAAAQPFGAPDILVNAAGINTREPADAVTAEGWDATLAVNLSAPFFLAQQLVPAMAERGWGRIINIASLQSVRAFTNGIAYGASKGGIVQLTRAMAEAWSPRGVCCNAIAPGFFPTALTAPVFKDEALVERLATQTMIGRNGRMEDLHGIAVFLAAPASDYVTGQTIFLDGGFTAR
jgi:NAD(P)-dependent dehydrogenase (short-subunit alcohol dehydrogenase family)